ncbi:hypothetical protein IV494_03655 [Kaistella sp. G5-32]|uniref:Uncharacterized protein n=1 Tax=Kaistella gelatinilytica TaxID=2787636 RepID=A0ABS0F9A4_9FLAO|nr:hypothetical protein [Kaistella gelatinilytica]MBF8456268.1 hypothetical protein [Kaistella gelatinilytica]
MNTENLLLKLSEVNKTSQQLDSPESERFETVEIVGNFANQFTGLDSVKAFQEKKAPRL